jgi:hypothetical protein
MKQYCSLAESLKYESKLDTKMVYLTEKGIDLFEAFPDIAIIDLATRRGYSWDNIMERLANNPISTYNKKHIHIVRTTEAELAAHGINKQKSHKPIIDHKTQLLVRIDAIPTSEWSMDRISDIIVKYMVEFNISDFGLSNSVCEIVGKKLSNICHKSNIMEQIDSLPVTLLNRDVCADIIVDYMATNGISSYDIADELCEILVNKGYIYSSPAQEVHTTPDNLIPTTNLTSVSAWLFTSFQSICTSIQELTLNIIPIPTNYEWVLTN